MASETEPGLILPAAERKIESIHRDLKRVASAAYEGLEDWAQGPDFNEYYAEDTQSLKKIAELAGTLAVMSAELHERLQPVIEEGEIPDTSKWMNEILPPENLPKLRQSENLARLTIIGPRHIEFEDDRFFFKKNTNKLFAFNLLLTRRGTTTNVRDARRYGFYKDVSDRQTVSTNWTYHMHSLMGLTDFNAPQIVEKVGGNKGEGFEYRLNPAIEIVDEREQYEQPKHRRPKGYSNGRSVYPSAVKEVIEPVPGPIQAPKKWDPSSLEDQALRCLSIKQAVYDYVINGTGEIPTGETAFDRRSIRVGLQWVTSQVNVSQDPEMQGRWDQAQSRIASIEDVKATRARIQKRSIF